MISDILSMGSFMKLKENGIKKENKIYAGMKIKLVALTSIASIPMTIKISGIDEELNELSIRKLIPPNNNITKGVSARHANSFQG